MSAARSRRKPPAKASGSARRRPPPAGAAVAGAPRLRASLRELYFGRSARAVRFRYALLAFDLVTIAFVIASSFFHGHPATEALDLVFGALILVEFCARLWISRPLGIADIIVILSFLAPLAGENFAFLRVMRALRLFAPTRWSLDCGATSTSSDATKTPCSAWSTSWSSFWS